MISLKVKLLMKLFLFESLIKSVTKVQHSSSTIHLCSPFHPPNLFPAFIIRIKRQNPKNYDFFSVPEQAPWGKIWINPIPGGMGGGTHVLSPRKKFINLKKSHILVPYNTQFLFQNPFQMRQHLKKYPLYRLLSHIVTHIQS